MHYLGRIVKRLLDWHWLMTTWFNWGKTFQIQLALKFSVNRPCGSHLGQCLESNTARPLNQIPVRTTHIVYPGLL
jgi:hypothetical protein